MSKEMSQHSVMRGAYIQWYITSYFREENQSVDED